MQHNRYMAFAYNQYYPGGGMDDFIGMYQTYDAAVAAVEAFLLAKREGGGDVFDIDACVSHGFALKCRSGRVEKIDERAVATAVLTTAT